MKNLMKIEWMKLKSYPTFWILIGLFVSLFLLANYGQYKSFVSLGSGPMNLVSSSYSFPQVWDNVGFTYSWFVIFLSVFVIISVSNEFTFRTGRQHVIDGLERLDYLHAKMILILIISIMSTVFFALVSLLFGLIGGGGNPLPHAERILYVLIFTINYLSFVALLAFLMKRSGLAIILFLAYLIFEFFVMKFINWKFSTFVGTLLPLQSSDELLPMPILNTLSNATGGIATPIMYSVAMSFFYISSYYLILRSKFLKSDM